MGAVLDPRYKMKLIEFCFPKIYEDYEVDMQISVVRSALFELYEEYAVAYASKHTETQKVQDDQSKSSRGRGKVSKGKTKGALDSEALMKSFVKFYLDF
ncbi:hypothetical protein Dimus_004256 [Dionaea muscipula]